MGAGMSNGEGVGVWGRCGVRGESQVVTLQLISLRFSDQNFTKKQKLDGSSHRFWKLKGDQNRWKWLIFLHFIIMETLMESRSAKLGTEWNPVTRAVLLLQYKNNAERLLTSKNNLSNFT